MINSLPFALILKVLLALTGFKSLAILPTDASEIKENFFPDEQTRSSSGKTHSAYSDSDTTEEQSWLSRPHILSLPRKDQQKIAVHAQHYGTKHPLALDAALKSKLFPLVSSAREFHQLLRACCAPHKIKFLERWMERYHIISDGMNFKYGLKLYSAYAACEDPDQALSWLVKREYLSEGMTVEELAVFVISLHNMSPNTPHSLAIFEDLRLEFLKPYRVLIINAASYFHKHMDILSEALDIFDALKLGDFYRPHPPFEIISQAMPKTTESFWNARNKLENLQHFLTYFQQQKNVLKSKSIDELKYDAHFVHTYEAYHLFEAIKSKDQSELNPQNTLNLLKVHNLVSQYTSMPELVSMITLTQSFDSAPKATLLWLTQTPWHPLFKNCRIFRLIRDAYLHQRSVFLSFSINPEKSDLIHACRCLQDVKIVLHHMPNDPPEEVSPLKRHRNASLY